jgi:hypothetical protein
MGVRYEAVEADSKKAIDPVPLIPTRTSLHAGAGTEMARKARPAWALVKAQRRSGRSCWVEKLKRWNDENCRDPT